MKRTPSTCFLGVTFILCLLLSSCGGPIGDEAVELPAKPEPQLVAVEGLGIVGLIELLAHPNELTRTRAHAELHRYVVVDTADPDYPERLTRFHKFAPHACRAGHEAQTLHILGLFAAQEDISSILITECLRSKHLRVRATALELARFSDNPLDEVLLAFSPDAATLASYEIALRHLGTPESEKRLAGLRGDG